MSDITRLVGSALIALILVSVPGLLVASFAFEWPAFLKVLFDLATVVECVMTMCAIYERGEG